jgi:hypothetical protein
MQFFEQKKGSTLNLFKSSMMRRVNKSILSMRGEHKSLLESLRADAKEKKDTEEDESGGYGLGMSRRAKGLKAS